MGNSFNSTDINIKGGERMAIEHEVMEAIDKELDKLPYTAAEVKIVLDGKTIICKYTKNKPLIGFADTKEK
jgi:hypothetical protein